MNCHKEFKSKWDKNQFCSDDCRVIYYDLDNPEAVKKIIEESIDPVTGRIKKGSKINKLKRDCKTQAEQIQWRKRLFDSILTEERLLNIYSKLIQKAEEGSNKEIIEVMNRAIGKVADEVKVTEDKVEWNINLNDITGKEDNIENNSDNIEGNSEDKL